MLRRCFEHKKKLIKGFTEKYNVDKLIYFEVFDYVDIPIKREKQIKGYSRAKKIALINKINSGWIDLYSNGKIRIPHSAEFILNEVNVLHSDDINLGKKGERAVVRHWHTTVLSPY